MKGNKILFLGLALVLPMIVFVFLKFFGRNEFNVEPLFQTNQPELSKNCPPVKTPYRIENPQLVGVFPGDSLTLIYFDNGSETVKEIARVKEEFKNKLVNVFSSSFVFSDSTTNQIKECILLLKDPLNSVLVDHDGLIRGQYNLNDLEEADRLIVEIKVLLKMY